MTPPLVRWSRWFAPGIGVKRWTLLLLLGVLLISAGAALIVNIQLLGWLELVVFQAALSLLLLTGGSVSPSLVGGLLIVLGVGLVFYGLRGTIQRVAGVLQPRGDLPLVEVLHHHRTRRRGRRVVAIGGGTGLSTLLRGLKAHTDHLTAVVTVFDDGGSSGRLRRELGILPPGDIRDCLVALAESEPLMTRLFEYRFQGGALDGHAFGNLFIASLAGVTGDLESAVKAVSKVLNIRGRVLPSAVEDVVLVATFDDGTVIEGESKITGAGRRIARVALKPADVAPLPEVLQAIADAELIVLGPGSLFTSVIPNLLVRGIADAIRANRQARTVYVCNVMTQPGETDGFSASEHVRRLIEAVGPGLFSHVLVNTRRPRSRAVLARYESEGAVPVEPDLDRIRALGVIPVAGSLISEEDVVRHDPAAVARALLRLAAAGPALPEPAIAGAR
ncbi:MAG TPA: gluconeogenesis factor YvcK family protein [bacterium]|nr:gluconeogenesis factor YvcK family protein [bacterium]